MLLQLLDEALSKERLGRKSSLHTLIQCCVHRILQGQVAVCHQRIFPGYTHVETTKIFLGNTGLFSHYRGIFPEVLCKYYIMRHTASDPTMWVLMEFWRSDHILSKWADSTLLSHSRGRDRLYPSSGSHYLLVCRLNTWHYKLFLSGLISSRGSTRSVRVQWSLVKRCLYHVRERERLLAGFRKEHALRPALCPGQVSPPQLMFTLGHRQSLMSGYVPLRVLILPRFF